MTSNCGGGARSSTASYLALVFDTVQDAVVATDTHGRVIDWNPAAERLFGYTRSEMLGRNAADVGIFDADPDHNAGEHGRWEGEV